MDPLRVLITMDVEPVKQDPKWTGPEDAQTSERLIRAYRNIARRHGFPVTFLIHPEAAALHAEMFARFEEEGHCLGLHLHPTKFSSPRYRHELGHYSADEQRQILSLAKAQWSQAIGKEPEYFRPGAFSANDATFPTLVSLGFRGGSVSIPGRIWPQRYCIWAGAKLDPHRANGAFRHVAGGLPFVNIPLSVDTRSAMSARGVVYYRDLRPNARETSAEETLRNIVAGLAKRQPAVPVVHLVAHNDQPFDDPNSASFHRLEEVLTRVGPVSMAHGFNAVGSTIGEVCDEVMALPPARMPEWLLPDDVPM